MNKIKEKEIEKEREKLKMGYEFSDDFIWQYEYEDEIYPDFENKKNN